LSSMSFIVLFGFSFVFSSDFVSVGFVGCFEGVLGCSEGVLGCSEGVVGCSEGVVGCSEGFVGGSFDFSRYPDTDRYGFSLNEAGY